MLDKERNHLISHAFRKANITSIESEPTEAEIDDAAHHLNSMLQSWNNDGFRLFKIKTGYMPFIPKINEYSLATQAYKSIESVKIDRVDRIGATQIKLNAFSNIASGQKIIVVDDIKSNDDVISDVVWGVDEENKPTATIILKDPLIYNFYKDDVVFYGVFNTATTEVKSYTGAFNTIPFDDYIVQPAIGDMVFFYYNGAWIQKTISAVDATNKTLSFSGTQLSAGSISNGIIVFGTNVNITSLAKDYAVEPRKVITEGFKKAPVYMCIPTGDTLGTIFDVEYSNLQTGEIVLKQPLEEGALLALGENKIIAEVLYPSQEELTWNDLTNIIPIQSLDWGSVTDTSDLHTDDWGYVTDAAGALLDWGTLTGAAEIRGFSKSYGTKYAIATNKKQNVTNKITYVPEDIKLELSDGTLTLKAGSKIYVPNGFGVYDEVVLDSDKTTTPSSFTTSVHRLIIYRNGNIYPFDSSIDYIYTSMYEPTVFDSNGKALWYDTVNNVIKYTNDSGSTWFDGYSFPIALVGITNGTGITAIERVFNGYGYMSSLLYVLPGVKCLAPNGRDENGNFVNIEYTVPSVVRTAGGTAFTGLYRLNTTAIHLMERFVVQETQPDILYGIWYNPKTNEQWYAQGGVFTRNYDAVCFDVVGSSGKFLSMELRPESESVYNVTDYYLVYDEGLGWQEIDQTGFDFTEIGLYTAKNTSFLYDVNRGLYSLSGETINGVYTAIGIEKILQYNGKWYLVSPKAEGTISRTVVETEDFLTFGTPYTIQLDSLANPAEFQSRLFIGSTDTYVGDMKTFMDINVYAQNRCVVGDRLLNLNSDRVCSYTKDGVNFYPMPMMLTNQTAWGYKDGCSFIAVYGILNGGLLSTQIFTANDFNPVWTPQVVVPGRVDNIFFDDTDAYFVSDVAVYSLKYRESINMPEVLKAFAFGEQICRPQQVMNVMKYGFDNQVELPMNPLSLQEFTVLPSSGLGGEPVNYCFFRDAKDGKMMVWGTPNKFGEYLKFSYVEPLTLLEDARCAPDFPDEYYEAVEDGLAAELGIVYGLPLDRQQALVAKAEDSKEKAMLHDNEDTSYNIVPNQRWQ